MFLVIILIITLPKNVSKKDDDYLADYLSKGINLNAVLKVLLKLIACGVHITV